MRLWQGLPDGRGRVVFANGDRLEGLFRHGHASGACELHTTRASGHEVFRGDFRAGNKHGFATVVSECRVCVCVRVRGRVRCVRVRVCVCVCGVCVCVCVSAHKPAVSR